MSLHLTRIQIDYETAHKAGLRDSYAWHQWAWQAFPGRPADCRDFLTRLDDTGEGFRFLIQSPLAPTRPPNCPEPAWETRPIPDGFFDRERFRFSLLANPTRKVRSNGKGELLKNSRRVPVFYDPEKKADPATRIDARAALVDWLARQATAHGFRFEEKNLKTVPRPRQVFVKKSRADEARHAGLHAAVEFVGELAVTDTAAFRRAVSTGIGPAKAFGFGMLCLAPLDA
jgi:CRISPR system Cascade subunit CasE